MLNVLLLVHRIPFPPDKGDKIRSYHLLRFLAQRHRVFVGAFVDDPQDVRHVDSLGELCAGCFVLPLDARKRRVASLSGFATGEALSLPYYRNREMQRWVDEAIEREKIDAIVAFSSTMAQYVEAAKYRRLVRIADFVDVDSDKWRQYAKNAGVPRRWIYEREAKRLLAYERRIAAEFDATLLVTAVEAQLMRSLAPEAAAKISFFENGVDTGYFDPSISFDDPYPPGGPVLLFTGAMDYWPNAEAVTWFAQEVLPLVHGRRPDVRFAIVGSNPTGAVRSLSKPGAIIVTGRVPDVRPYLAHAAVAVAPLRIARGIQNKVLEAMAMARPVLCTPAAAQGLKPAPVVVAATAADPAAMAAKAIEMLDVGARPEHRDYAVAHYGWEANLRVVERLLARQPGESSTPESTSLEAA